MGSGAQNLHLSWDSGTCAPSFIWSLYPGLNVYLQKSESKTWKVYKTRRVSEGEWGIWCPILQSTAGVEGHQRQTQWWKAVYSFLALSSHWEHLGVPNKIDHATFLLYIPPSTKLGYELNIVVHLLHTTNLQPLHTWHTLDRQKSGWKEEWQEGWMDRLMDELNQHHFFFCLGH